MRNKTGIMEKTLKRVQGDISGLCKTGNKPTCVALQGDMLGLCKTSNYSTCVAPQNDRFCHSELVSESIQ